MSDVLLGQSYYLRFDQKLWEAMQPYPPLGTMYAASFLRERGYAVALFDAMLAASEEEWRDALQREKPRFAVIFEDNFNYLSKMCLLRMRQAAYAMIQMACQAGCSVIVCGSDASDHAAEYLDQGASYVLYGEGEATLTELLDALSEKNTRPVAEILGLAYQDADTRQVRRTPRRPDLHELDALPFPAWDLIDVERYRAIWLERHGYYSMNMVTTRGCPFHCNWCAKPIWGQRYNSRSPENVVAEMKWLQQAYHPDHIWFADDLLGLKPGWLETFASVTEREGVRIPFKSLNRVDLLLRGETISALARAGADIVWVGAESGSQKILDAMEKGTRVEQIYEAARRLRAAGVRVGFFLHQIAEARQPARFQPKNVIGEPDVVGLVAFLEPAHFSGHVFGAARVITLSPDRLGAPVTVERAAARGDHVHRKIAMPFQPDGTIARNIDQLPGREGQRVEVVEVGAAGSANDFRFPIFD